MSKGNFLAVFTALFLIAAFNFPTTVDAQDPATCCTRKNVPLECHFLCGEGSTPSIWTVVRWKCTHKYYATVATCKINDKINYVKLFGQKFTQSVKNGFDKLTDALKQKLTDAANFASATIDELKTVPQDVLSSLKESLGGMTKEQFGGLLQRLVRFTSQNLRNLVSDMNLAAFMENLGDINKIKDWDQEQLAALSKGAYRKYGPLVKQWPSDAFAKLKEILAGVDAEKLAQMGADAFKKSVDKICSVKFNTDQKIALMGPAKEAYGDVAQWSDEALQKMCNILEALPVDDILKLPAKAVSSAIDTISKLEFSHAQGEALIAKLKEEWGDVKQWTLKQLQDIGPLIRDLDIDDLANMAQDNFKNLMKKLGEMEWNPAQARELAKKAIETLGPVKDWTADNLKDLGNVVEGLLPSELNQIKDSVIQQSLGYIKNSQLAIDQAQVIVNKLKNATKLDQLKKADLIAVAKQVDGFLSSDIGKMSQGVVFLAFPELAVPAGAARPIIRSFIKKYEAESKPKNIGMMGNVATGLARDELDQTPIEAIIQGLDKVGALPWDKTQVIELAKRVEAEWGKFNDTEVDDSDSPNWGFENFRKLGRVALGIAKQELRNLPIRGIEDVIDALGKQKDWDRGQLRNVLDRLRDYWQMEDLNFANFTELDINSLGSFVQGLTEDELKSLPEKVVLVAIRRLGEAGLPEDKLKSRAYLAVEYIKNQTGLDILNATNVRDLGGLVAGLSKSALRKITKEGFLTNLYDITRAQGFTMDKLREIASLAKKHFEESDVGKWTGVQLRKLGPAVQGLSSSDLRRINKKSLEEILGDLGQMANFTVGQANALIDAAKEAWGESDVGKWSGDKLRKLGSLVKGLTADDINRLTKDAFEQAVGLWGEREDIDLQTLKALASKAKQYLADSDAGKMSAAMVKRMGRVVLGLEPKDLEKLKLDNIDIIAALGRVKEWTSDQLEKLKPKVKEFVRNNVDDDVYMFLGKLAVVLEEKDIKLIPKKAFSHALKQFGETTGWTDDQLKALADRAKGVWEQTADQWDKAKVSELGEVIRGLVPKDISKLTADVVDAIEPKNIKAMSAEQLQAFSPAQFEAMETPQVQAISAVKKESLTAEQQQAINDVIDRDPDAVDPWGPDDDCSGHTCSGCRFYSSLWMIVPLVSSAVYFRQ